MNINRIEILKKIFHEEESGTYVGGSLSYTFMGKMIFFLVGKGENADEDCWIALNYLKYKLDRIHQRESLEILKRNPKYNRLTIQAVLSFDY